MKKVNLRELYPDIYKTDVFIEVSSEVQEVFLTDKRAEAARQRQMYNYKAYYSLDCDNGIEKQVVYQPPTPEMLMEEKQLREQLYSAVMALPEKQAKRIYARFYLGMTVKEIAKTECEMSAPGAYDIDIEADDINVTDTATVIWEIA